MYASVVYMTKIDPRAIGTRLYKEGKIPRMPSSRVIKTLELQYSDDAHKWSNAEINIMAGYATPSRGILAAGGRSRAYTAIREEIDNGLELGLAKSMRNMHKILDNPNSSEEVQVKIFNALMKHKPKKKSGGMKRHHNDIEKQKTLTKMAKEAIKRIKESKNGVKKQENQPEKESEIVL